MIVTAKVQAIILRRFVQSVEDAGVLDESALADLLAHEQEVKSELEDESIGGRE